MGFESKERMKELTREEVDRLTGLVLLEFGAEWCPFCQALQPGLRELLTRHPGVRHIKVADGKGKPLGRSFRVKLWPTLVFMKDGKVESQISRPSDQEVQEGFWSLSKG